MTLLGILLLAIIVVFTLWDVLEVAFCKHDYFYENRACRVTLWKSGGDMVSSVEKPLGWTDKSIGDWEEVLVEVYRDGKLIKDYKFDEIRANSNA